METIVARQELHRLAYVTGATDVADELPKIFGHLVKIAAPIMRAFQCDLYNDALWLREHVKGESFRFLWSVNDTGTSIGIDTLALTREHKYALTVFVVEGSTRLKIVDLSGLGPASLARIVDQLS